MMRYTVSTVGIGPTGRDEMTTTSTAVIWVEAQHSTPGQVTSLRARVEGGRYMTISRRQYQSASRRLHLVEGDSLRLAPVGDGQPPAAVIVADRGREWAIIS